MSYTIATSPVQGLCYGLEEEIMDKEIKGAVKQAVGKVAGNAKLASKADKVESKVQNAIGGLKDTLKGK